MLTDRQREILPTTRESTTHKFSVNGFEGYLTVGLFDDGRPGEIFIKMSKEGSTLSGLIQGFCRSFSISLQYGLPVDDAVRRFKGMRFEPSGGTSNPDIPEASSILDYIARYLELQFGEVASEPPPAGRPAPTPSSEVRVA
ncbi:MAG: hypothetical protein GY894_01625 [Planctomycetes bacterium]|jgi:ribonucleoside-diphosphate reductase alpha chain|nr:hypothetical protein [Planctomycetota bacterium]MCP4838049.1 hypothetical protein [Planctomycetota bacterium]